MHRTAIERKIEHLSISVKAVGEDGQQGTIQGLLSTWDLDLGQDKVIKGAFAGTIRAAQKRRAESGSPFLWPLLWQHNADSLPIGGITSASESSKGLLISAKLDLAQPQAQQCYDAVKFGSISGMSIGYRAQDVSYEKDASTGKTIRLIKSLDLLEGSLVLWPMQPAAQITSVKKGGSSMFGKTFNTRYQAQSISDWLYDDFNDLSVALGQSIQDLFGTGMDPMQALESDVIPGLLSAIRAYVQAGVDLGYTGDSGMGMDMGMMSMSGAGERKAGYINAATHAQAITAVDNVMKHAKIAKAALASVSGARRYNESVGQPLYSGASDRSIFEEKAEDDEAREMLGILANSLEVQNSLRELKELRESTVTENPLVANVDHALAAFLNKQR